jgi:MFS transporter, ACS family, pantothenate transporter
MNDSAYIVGVWLVLIIWQQVDAPQYRKGFITASVFSAGAIVLVLVVRTLAKRELLRYV